MQSGSGDEMTLRESGNDNSVSLRNLSLCEDTAGPWLVEKLLLGAK